MKRDEFHDFLVARDCSVILKLPNNGPGPDLAMWLNKHVLMVVGIKTSPTSKIVSNAEADKNRRSTDPNFWWHTNEFSGGDDATSHRGRAKRELFLHKTPIRLLIRVHVCLPEAQPTSDQEQREEFTQSVFNVQVTEEVGAKVKRRKCFVHQVDVDGSNATQFIPPSVWVSSTGDRDDL